MSTTLLIVLVILTFVSVYILWIRPVLKQRPAFGQYYAQEASLWGAFKLKMQGMRQWLTAVLSISTGFIVTLYDAIVDLAKQIGFDWSNVTTITDKVPPLAWPLIAMAIIALMQWFRELSNKRVQEVLEDKGVDPKAAQIAPVNTEDQPKPPGS